MCSVFTFHVLVHTLITQDSKTVASQLVLWNIQPQVRFLLSCFACALRVDGTLAITAFSLHERWSYGLFDLSTSVTS